MPSPFFLDTRLEHADTVLLSLARNLQERAEEVLAQADTYHDADAREMMFKIAWGYEKLARRLEQVATEAAARPVSQPPTPVGSRR